MTDYVAAPSPDFQKLDTSSWLTKYAAIIIILYLAAGTAGFVYFEADGESPLEWTDACYFCVITLTTVGYGDLAPTTDESKLFAIVYIVLGSRLSQLAGALAGARRGPILSSATPLPRRRFSVPLPGVYRRRARRRRLRRRRDLCLLQRGLGRPRFHLLVGRDRVDGGLWRHEVEQETTRQFLVVYALVAVGAFATSLSKFGSIIMDVEARSTSTPLWSAASQSACCTTSRRMGARTRRRPAAPWRSSAASLCSICSSQWVRCRRRTWTRCSVCLTRSTRTARGARRG